MAIESTPHPSSKRKANWFPHCFESINGADGTAELRYMSPLATARLMTGTAVRSLTGQSTPDLTMPDLVNDSQHDAPANDHVRSG